MNVPQLGPADLGLAACLLALPALASAWWKLGLLRPLATAALRMGLQLSAAGYILTWLLDLASPLWVAAVLMLMVLFATREAVGRQDTRFRGWGSHRIALAATATALVAALGTALLTAVRPVPWFEARVLIPLAGMILGNSLTAIALVSHSLSDLARREARAIEARLALGDSFQTAFTPLARRALTQALMPIINNMAATGLVFLPGVMTGQILAGVEPLLAVKYQILIMFLLAGGTSSGALVALRLTIRRLADRRGRLRLDRLQTPRPH